MLRGASRSALAGLLLLIIGASAGAQTGAGSGMEVTGRASAPIGAVQFCRTHPGECRRRGAASAVKLDRHRWDELVAVNAHVNAAIAPVTDADLYGAEEVWTLPADRGDCEDYVLLKRRLLIERGWPSGALLVTVVFDEVGDGHAVLVARTDRGELVLDNKVEAIRLWHETVYRYVKRQSSSDPKGWVAVADRRWQTTTSSLR